VSSVPSLSPSSGHELPSKNEAMVVPSEANQSLYRQRKIKTKSKKIGLKVARDRLTKKWTVVMMVRQFRGAIELVMLLEALEMFGRPLKVALSTSCPSSRVQLH
jgi:hypothetical protein